ncbi:hypothetical protein CPB86DRAFT_787791 [Serendipita vermifera]|nr:hypothetical protein CPB86DRAFT_787791 [Serendipita vermifera]
MESSTDHTSLLSLFIVATPQQPRQRKMSRAPSKTPSYGSIDPGERWEHDNTANEATTLISTTPMPSYPSSLATRLGFQKRSNLYLYLTLSSLMLLFCVSQFAILFTASPLDTLLPPGEAFWFKQGFRKVALYIHMWSIIPCGILMVFQFIPKIRRSMPALHRLNGRIVLLLFIPGAITAILLTPNSFGGEAAGNLGLAAAFVCVSVSGGMGYYNIRAGQIMEHRKWMLRWMAYLTSIVTARLFLVISGLIVSQTKSYTVWTCEELNFTLQHEASNGSLSAFPECIINPSASHLVIVPADMNDAPLGVASAFRSGFGAAMWLSLALHAFLVEAYLSYSSTESKATRRAM